jgi:hypothetical protein
MKIPTIRDVNSPFRVIKGGLDDCGLKSDRPHSGGASIRIIDGGKKKGDGSLFHDLLGSGVWDHVAPQLIEARVLEEDRALGMATDFSYYVDHQALSFDEVHYYIHKNGFVPANGVEFLRKMSSSLWRDDLRIDPVVCIGCLECYRGKPRPLIFCAGVKDGRYHLSVISNPSIYLRRTRFLIFQQK